MHRKRLEGMQKNNPHVLGTEPIGKLLTSYSVPAVIAMTVTSLYNIIDSMFIGQGVGALAISGLAIVFPLMNLLMAFCTLVGVGGATISSIRLGQKDIKGAEEILGNVTTLSILMAVLYGGITFIFLDDILRLFGASDATLPYARDFMQVVLIGSPIAYIMISLNNVMRATGYPKQAMLSMIITVVVNIILAPVFIFIFKWGMRGVAFATLISQIVGMAWVLHHFCKKSSYIHFRSGIFKLKKRIVKNIFSIGMAPFFMNVCACLVTIFINNRLLNYGDDYSIGAFGITNRMQMLFVMIVMGIAQGMQPIVGYNYGAQNFARVKKALKYGIVAGVSITTIGFVCGVIFPEFFVNLFTDDPHLVPQSVDALWISMVCFPFVGAQIVICQFFQSIGKAFSAIFLSLSRQLVFLLPGLAILPLFYDVDGIWISMPVSDFLATFLAAELLLFNLRKKGIENRK